MPPHRHPLQLSPLRFHRPPLHPPLRHLLLPPSNSPPSTRSNPNRTAAHRVPQRPPLACNLWRQCLHKHLVLTMHGCIRSHRDPRTAASFGEQPCHPLTLPPSLPRPLTLLPSHPLALLPSPPSRSLTLSPSCPLTLSPSYPLALLPSYPLALLPSYPLTLLPSYPLTLLPSPSPSFPPDHPPSL